MPNDRAALGRNRRLLQAGHKVSLGFVEGLNNKIRVIQRRAYGLRDEQYLKLKILTCMLPAL
jgi:transposase